MARRYRFDDIEVDLESFRILKAGRPVAVEPKALNLLIFLIENRGRLVERRELIDAVWSGAFVTDHVLNRAIGQLRRQLADDAREPRYVETVPTLGYRFIANVEAEMAEAVTSGAGGVTSLSRPVDLAARQGEVPDSNAQRGSTESASSQGQEPVDETVPAPSISGPARVRGRMAIAAGIALALVLSLVTFWILHRRSHFPRARQIKSLAVLPLENLSGDASQQYLADGMTDELISSLGRIGALRVISQTTAMQYKNIHKPLPQIAGELNVDAVVEGSVLRSGDRIRVVAQLVEAATEKQLWAHNYEGDIRDLLGLQSQVAGAVAEQIRIKVTPTEQSQLADTQKVNPGAYEALLKGNFFFRQNTPETAKKSLQFFQQALNLDPNLARAYVGVARSYNFLGEGTVPSGEATAAADAALAKALQLEPDLAEAYAERGWTLLFYHWDFPGAERDFRHALELEPGSTDAHEGYADYLTVMGRFDDAFGEMRKARDLDPLSPLTLTDYCSVLFMAHRFADAEAQCSAALELDPNYPWALSTIADIYEIEGKYPEAHKIYDRLFGCDQACADGIDEEFGRPGKSGKFEAWMHPSPDLNSIETFYIAEIYAGVGDKEKAFTWLERAYSQRIAMHGLVFLAVDPHFDNLRSDARFDAFLRRAGLPPQPHSRLAQPDRSAKN
jgi:TolB-like protein/DNA-binding winged helix-turn-helix (wHTH) protein/Tfp pilus assembly protein PilF